ncbi:hypothetical protein [Novosphingobium pentaromativorans]|uniref:O-antigen polymerase n=1 Tax=Novosphingobium pentaromativorans US6-1 TaxID=1088721 RepID=G6EAA2_9SPHN|nr:hypothetical protein [Novosphingobium pentaromativorans]AIT80762.1 hypothetical protein JI59_13740 [Novosphingobium pentaromativorans US6-1]EHJ61764.1 hypothetical protein NSU_1273 [Novosphingobium pentaromativorans US6-1]
MINLLPIAIFWALAAWGLISRKPVLIYLFFVTMPFGAFAAVPTFLTGGLTFTPTPLVTLLIIVRTFCKPQGPAEILTLALTPHKLMLLFLFWLVAAVTTVFMPRLFENAVMIVPIRGILSDTAPLRPTLQNLSQFTYLTIAVFSVFAFTVILQSPNTRQHALKALSLGAAVTAATGLIDHASRYLPLDPLLTPFRTATYALVTDVEVLGARRVVGLMPEASAYGGVCLAFMAALYFYRRAMLDETLRTVLVPGVLALLALCAWLSTSSGTYVGIALLAAVAGLEWLLRANADGHRFAIYRQGLAGELCVLVSLMVGLSLLLIVRPEILTPVYDLIDRMVLQKSASNSFAERGMWRSIAWDSIVATHGFGVGIGSTRASSSFIAILSGAGLIGGALYYAFALLSLLRPVTGTPIESQLLVAGFRFSFVPSFVVTLMVGDADFGGMTAFGFGLVTALSISDAKRREALLAPTAYPAVRQSV